MPECVNAWESRKDMPNRQGNRPEPTPEQRLMSQARNKGKGRWVPGDKEIRNKEIRDKEIRDKGNKGRDPGLVLMTGSINSGPENA